MLAEWISAPVSLEGTTIPRNAACDAAIHNLRIRIARNCAEIIRPLLRQEVIGEWFREIDMASRGVIVSKSTRGGT